MKNTFNHIFVLGRFYFWRLHTYECCTSLCNVQRENGIPPTFCYPNETRRCSFSIFDWIQPNGKFISEI